MGNSYGRRLTHWSRGDYPGANNVEDDEAVIASQVGWRADEGSISVASRRGLQQYDAIIGGPSDRDIWQLPSNGLIILDTTPDRFPSTGGNLDLKATIADRDGNVLWLGDTLGPADLTGDYIDDAHVSLIVEPGTVTTPQEYGYDTYGNRGRYRLWFGFPMAWQHFGLDGQGLWSSGDWEFAPEASLVSNGSFGSEYVSLPANAFAARAIDLSGKRHAWLMLRWRCFGAGTTDIARVSFLTAPPGDKSQICLPLKQQVGGGIDP